MLPRQKKRKVDQYQVITLKLKWYVKIVSCCNRIQTCVETKDVFT